MSLELVAGLTLSFLGGVLTASLGFMLTYSSRLTKVETQLKGLCDRIDERAVCPMHPDLERRVNSIDKGLAVVKAERGS